MSIMTGDEKHSRASTSTLDVLWALYDRVLQVDPDDPANADRDRFFLSKGHGPVAYYAVLAARGFIDPESLRSFGAFTSILGHHPDRKLIPGVEISSGSLGQGIALGVGSAYAIRLSGSSARVFVMIGDGELDEGSNHEAIALAARLGLENLIVVVIDNDSSTHRWPGGIGSRFDVEGWRSVDVDGRNQSEITSAFTTSHTDRPLAVVAKVGGLYA
ncbi:MAG: thiamine pyrophosphate-dependent enzyme [Actinomycetia bacterium]|nr:thiamine pyrophosphate-dependent enzyme [Actinomycetes bacterium]